MPKRKVKDKKASCCPRCLHKGYSWKIPRISGDDRPVFQCGSCNHEWSYGRDGGHYMKGATNVKTIH